MTPKLRRLHEDLSTILNEVRGHFIGERKVTLIVRDPTNDDADVLLTNDTPAGMRAVIDRLGRDLAPPKDGAASRRPPITHVAIRFRGKVWSLPKPNRHHDVIRLIVEETGVASVDTHGDDQGFLDASGRYLTRKQAIVSARLNDQIIKTTAPAHGLFSEDVW